MLRLYQPCLPKRSMKAPSGPNWIHEIKHDGFRIVARRVGGMVRRVQSLFDRVEAYGFECEAGPLRNCAEWIELRRRLNLPPTFPPKGAR
jgi:hypothetical protein